MIVSLSDLVRHLNLPEDQDVELLNQKLAVAHAIVGSFMGVDLSTEYTQWAAAVYMDPDPNNEVPGMELPVLVTPEVISNAPDPVKESVLRYAAHLYECREGLDPDARYPHPPSDALFDLLSPYRTWSF